jgi:F-type H+-transporting ATPase subunit delta
MKLNFVGVRELVSRYVKAILVVANNYKIINIIHDDFRKLEKLFFDDNFDLAVFKSSAINKSTKHKIIDEIAKLLKLNKITKDLLSLMLSNGRFFLIRHCIKLFFIEYNKLNNIVDVVIVSSEQVSDQEKKTIEGKLSKKTGSKLECEYEIDPKIISGLVIKIAGTTYDFSAKSRLNFILQKSIEKIVQLS